MNFLKSLNKYLFFGRFINSYKHFSIRYLLKNDLSINEFNFKTNFISRCVHSIPLSIYKSNISANGSQFNALIRTFIENENQYAFQVIESTLSHENSDFSSTLDQNIDENSNNIYNKFMETSLESYYKSSTTNALIESLNKFSTRQLTKILESMTLWPIVTNAFEPTYYKLWSSLDEELTKRLNKDSFHDKQSKTENLTIANLWFKLKLAKFCKFNLLLVKKLNSPDLNLNKSEFVHLMFYMNLHRKIDEKTKPNIWNHFEKLSEDMSLDELGVICMTFFKTQTKLPPKSIPIITSKAVNHISDHTNNVIRASIFKAIRFSYHFSHKEDVKSLIDRSKQLNNYSEIALTHLVSLTNEASIYDKTLFDDAFSKLHLNPSAFRAKDIERLLFCFANFNHKIDLNKLEPICKHIETSEDTAKYPWFLISILHHFCLMEYFPETLIRRCFEPTFLDKIQNTSKLDFRRSLLIVNTSLLIEKFSEFGHLLLTPQRMNRMHRRVLYLEKSDSVNLSKKTLLINSIYMSLKSELTTKVQLCHIFPFNSYPFVVISSDGLEKFSALAQLRENMFNNCVVINILSLKDYADSERIVRGINVLEIRLLKKLGFKVLNIPWFELTSFRTSKGRKNKILSEIQKLI